MPATFNNARHAASGIATEYDSGWTRSVFLIQGYIYKIEHDIEDAEGANLSEWEAYNRLRNTILPPNVAIPHTQLFHVDGKPIIAMEYINGTPKGECYCIDGEEHIDCIPLDQIEELHKVTGISDLCYGNLIERDGRLYIVDLEC